MDLRTQSLEEHVERAKVLSMSGLMNYQPYRLSDGFYCGGGLSILRGHLFDPPTVFCPSLDPSMSDYASKALVKEAETAEFIEANNRVAALYDNLIQQVAHHLVDMKGLTVLDVGCNAGYFPVSFERLGARATGYDLVDYGPTFALMNEVCGTRAHFQVWKYDGSTKAEEQFDVVLSTAVLVHLSEPLRHLAWLGSSAKRALLVLTPCHESDDLSVRYHSVNRYYSNQFPNCFDVVTPSKQMLRLAFAQMGFETVIDLDMAPFQHWQASHLCLLGLR